MPVYCDPTTSRIFHVPTGCPPQGCTPGIAFDRQCCRCAPTPRPPVCFDVSCDDGEDVDRQRFGSMPPSPPWSDGEVYDPPFEPPDPPTTLVGKFFADGELYLDTYHDSGQSAFEYLLGRPLDNPTNLVYLAIDFVSCEPGADNANRSFVDVIGQGGFAHVRISYWPYAAAFDGPAIGLTVGPQFAVPEGTVRVVYVRRKLNDTTVQDCLAANGENLLVREDTIGGFDFQFVRIGAEGKLPTTPLARWDNFCYSNLENLPSPITCCCLGWPTDLAIDCVLTGGWLGEATISPSFSPQCMRWVESIPYEGTFCDDGVASVEIYCDTDGQLKLNLSSNDPNCNPGLTLHPFTVVDCGPPFRAETSVDLGIGCACGPVTVTLTERGSMALSKRARQWIDRVRG